MRLSAYNIALVPLIALAISSATANAQTSTKKAAHKPKPVAADKDRISNTDLGISYVQPQDFNPTKAEGGADLMLEGPRPKTSTSGGTYQSGNTRVTITRYLKTIIAVVRLPESRAMPTEIPTTSEAAKALLDGFNKVGALGANPLNYQNSAPITIAGHKALAVLAETSVEGLPDRTLVRLILLIHRGRIYIFTFNTIDVEFEAKVPAFEAFMNSVKFLQPDISPTEKKGPVEIKIDH